MKKTKIFYVFGYNDGPESEYVKFLKDNLDSKKFEVISDYYAQYNPDAALIDLKNYIEQHKIDIIIGENLGGYLVTLLSNDITRIVVNPILYPDIELKEYEVMTKDEKGNEVKMKMVPPHIIKFYKDSKIKPNYSKKIFALFDNDNNLSDYQKLENTECNISKSAYNSLIQLLNKIG